MLGGVTSNGKESSRQELYFPGHYVGRDGAGRHRGLAGSCESSGVVDVVHDGGQVVASGSGDNDLLGAGIDVCLSLGLLQVGSGHVNGFVLGGVRVPDSGQHIRYGIGDLHVVILLIEVTG